jgi:hypothetical protein
LIQLGNHPEQKVIQFGNGINLFSHGHRKNRFPFYPLFGIN